MGFGFGASTPLDQVLMPQSTGYAPPPAPAPEAPAAAPPPAPPQAPADSYQPSKFDIFMDMLANGHTPADAALKVRQRDYAVQQQRMMMDALQNASPEQRAAMLLNPAEFGKSMAGNFGPVTASAGQHVQYFGPNGPGMDVPTTGVSSGGQGYAISPKGMTMFPGVLAGQKSATNGLVMDQNQGPVGTYSSPQQITPGSAPGAFTPQIGGVGGAPSAGPVGAPPSAGGSPPMQQPRGIRNLNFGNLKTPATGPWQGQVGVDKDGYAIFSDPAAGVKAAATNLSSYAKQGIDTVAGVLARWAPAKDGNNTPAYAAYVASKLGVKPTDTINLADPKVQQGVLRGIFEYENTPQGMNGWKSPKASAPVGQRGQGGWQVGQPVSATHMLSDEEAAGAGLAPGAAAERDPSGHTSVVQPGYGPDQIFSLRRQVLDSDQYKNYQQANDAYGAMVSAAAQPNGGMRAYALRDTFARLINPGAVARVGTIQAIAEAQGVPANVRAYMMNLKGDGNVPPEIAQQILDVSHGFLSSHYKAAKSLNDNAADFAKRKKIDPEDVSAPMGEAPARMQLGPVPQDPKMRVPGTIYATPRGPLVWSGAGAKPWKAVR